MINNFLGRQCDEVSPENLFLLMPYYTCAATLLIINQALIREPDKYIYTDETIKELKTPITTLQSQAMSDALYTYFYNELPGIPEEKLLLSFISLPQFAFEKGQEMLLDAENAAFSKENLEETVKVEMNKSMMA